MKRLSAFVTAAVLLTALWSTAAPAATGRVLNENGKPIENAKVYVVKYGEKTPQMKIIYTDKAGKFSIDTKEKDYRQFCVTANGYCWAQVYWHGDQSPDITLTPELKVRGKVVDENGKPVAGATVRVDRTYAYGDTYNSIDFIGALANMAKVTTGPDGTFVLQHMFNPDSFTHTNLSLNVTANGRAMIRKNIPAEEIRKELVITDPPECTLEGTLYLPDKTAAPEGANVMVQIFGEKGEWETRDASTDKQGRFVFKQLPPGKANFMLGSPEYMRIESNNMARSVPKPRNWALSAILGLDLKPRETTRLDPVMTAGALIKGTVSNKADGKPITYATMQFQHAGRPEGMPGDYMMTNDKGEYAIRVAAGNVNASVQAFQQDQIYAYFQDDEKPTISFQAADGEEKPDVSFKVSAADSRQSMRQLSSRPIPPDFELTPGAYELAWEPDEDCSEAIYSSQIRLNEKMKSEIKGLPKLVSDRAQHLAYQFDGTGDGGMLLMIVDESKGSGKGWDTVYVDANRNWDLSDDAAITFTTPEQYRTKIMPPVAVQSRQGRADGEHASNPVQVRVRIYSYGDGISARPMRNGAWKGKIGSNKGEIRCVVADTNSNGIYGDRTTVNDEYNTGECDYIFADTNGAGEVWAYRYGSQVIMLNEVAKVGEKFYTIKTNEIGSKITIEPYTGEMGRLLVRGQNVHGAQATADSVSVIGKPGAYTLDGSKDEAVDLPVGKYKVGYCSLSIESKGKKFPLSCDIDTETEIKPGKQNIVTISGGLSMAINPEKKEMVMKPGQHNAIEWNIKIGDRIAVNSIGYRNQNSTPKVRFYDAEGKLVHEGAAGFT